MSTTTDEYQLDSSVSSKKKRPVESANEPLKRRRLAYGLTATSSAGAAGEHVKSNCHEEPSFLPFHLDLLESLYNHSKETTRASSEQLDPAIFDSARLFLQHRFQLLEAKHEANRWNGIYQEALSLPDTIRPPTIHPSPGNFVQISGLRQHSPLHSATTPSTIAAHHLMMHAGKPHQIPCYNIVAHFIGRKSKKAAATSKEQVEPYRPLLGQVEKLVDALEKTTEEQQESLNVLHGTRLEKLLSSNPSTTDCKEDDSVDYHSLTLQRRSILCATEYKAKLWKMLVDDLQQVFA